MASAVPTGHRVTAPTLLEGTLAVYRNGVPVVEGTDFAVDGDTLVFTELLNCGRKTGFLGRLQMTTVGIGVYEQVDKVDIHLTRPDGSFALFAELEATASS
jgi:hypothetical protein